MMTTIKLHYFFFLSLFIFMTSCKNSVLSQAQSQIPKEINLVENNLLPDIHLIGEAPETFNLQERMKYYNVPGVSIVVVKNGNIHWSKSYGLINAEQDIKVDNNTMFQAASITKPITAVGILKLVEQNKINLDDEVNKYLKDWQIQENDFTKKEKVTIRRLLMHTAGLNVHGFDGYAQSDYFPTVIEVLNGEGNSRRVVVENTPGEAWRYSGGGFVILQKLIEDVTGQKFEDFMQTEILKPLKMNNSTYQQPLDKGIYKNVSSAHNNDGSVLVGGWNNYPEKGPGGLWSTPEDFVKYCIEIQNIINGKKNGILKKETVDMMLTQGLHNWGLGLMVEGSDENLRFTHDGKNEGFNTEFLAFANKGDAVVIMTNGNTRNLKNEILKSVSSVYYWNTYNQREIKVLNLSTSDLEKYTGRYSWTERPHFIIEVVIRDGKLNFVAPGYPIDNLTPSSKSDFIDLETGAEVKFKILDSGEIDGLTWRGRFEFEKIH